MDAQVALANCEIEYEEIKPNFWMPTWMVYFIMVHETRLDRRIVYPDYEDQRPKSKNNIATQKETNERLRLLRRRITEEYNWRENKHSFTLDVLA